MRPKRPLGKFSAPELTPGDDTVCRILSQGCDKGVTHNMSHIAEKMESHPAWVKWLRMASIWTRSGHETYIGRKKEDVFETKGHLSRKDQKIGSAISLKI